MFDSRSCFMLGRKALLTVALILVLSIGSAEVLTSFGVISGTANVDSALNISSVSNSNDNVTIQNNMETVFDSSSDNYDLLVNDTDQNVTQQDIDSGAKVNYSVENLDGSSTVKLQINGNIVNSKEVGN